MNSGLILIFHPAGAVLVTSPFDYEVTQSYHMEVRVADQGTDPGPLSTTVLLTVVITDYNEDTPT